jgi:trimeric autotransporter adhesin
MRKALIQATIATLFCSALVLAQSPTISTFAGGGLPVNIPGTSANVGALASQLTFSLENYTGALGRGSVDASGNLYFIAFNSVMQLNAATGVVSLIAGNGTVGFSGDNNLAPGAQLNNPFAVAVDSSGNIYISDTNNFRVRKVSPSGLITTIAGNGTKGYSGDGGSALSAQLSQPAGIAVDSAGNVYVADQAANVIRKISGGNITTVAGGGSILGDGGQATNANLSGPLGLAIDSGNNLYIADRQNSRIRKVTVSSGVISTVAGNGTFGFSGDGSAATSAQIAFPSDVAVDSTGNIYIADLGNHRIRKVTTGGVISTLAGTGAQGFTSSGPLSSAQFWQPASIAADNSGNVFVLDSGNNRIVKVSTGAVSIVLGGGSALGDGGPATNGQLGYPTGITTDAAGNVYIADQINQRVRKVSGGVITTIAGGGTALGDGGNPNGAQLFQPEAVAVDSSGNVYIADTGASRVRKVSGNVITTVAGTGTAGFSGDGGPATSAQLGWPVGLAVDTNGNLYIADQFSNRVRVISTAGIISTFAGGGASTGDGIVATGAQISPAGLAVDAANNVYIADTLSHKVRKIVGGLITTVAGSGTASFSGDGGQAINAGMSPIAVRVDAAGNIYIVDLFNSRIRKVSASGIVTTIAGNGQFGFSGDGAVATNSVMDLPEDIAVDSAGNIYIADTGNNRIRVIANGTTSGCTYTLSPTSLQPTASGGTFPVGIQTTSSCAWSVTGLPTWITVSGPSSGTGPATVNLVVAANTGAAQNATLTIAGTSFSVNQGGTSTTCTFTLSPNVLAPTAAGGTFPIGILTNSGCSWTVSGLPNWITISGATSGTGPTTILLVVAPNAGPTQSATISIGGIGLTVNQGGTAVVSCVTSLGNGGQAFGAGGGSGSFTVAAPNSCAWTASSTAFWITTSSTGTGNGAVVFQVLANTGPARAATINISGVSYTVEQSASSITGFTSAGSMADLTVAGGWSTGITLVNPGTAATQFRLSFFDSNGNPLTIPLTFPQSPAGPGPLMASSIDRTLNPGAVLQINMTGPQSQTTTSGWVQVLANGSVNGFATFRFTAGSLDHQALIPFENRGVSEYLLPYDNTNGFADGIAITNTGSTSASVGFMIRNDTGATVYSSTITVLPMGSTTFVLPSSYGFTANSRGSIEIDSPSPGQVSILGIQYNTVTGGFSTIPALEKQ